MSETKRKDYIIEFNDRLYDLKDIFAEQYFVHKDLCGKVRVFLGSGFGSVFFGEENVVVLATVEGRVS